MLRGVAGSIVGAFGLAVGRNEAAAAVCPNGKRSYGSFCTTNAQCQTGFCFKPGNGNNRCLCRDVRQQPCGDLCSPCPGPGICGGCADNCNTGSFAECGPEGSGCGCVRNADGGSACIERVCTGVPCTTGAQCESGVCVIVPGCCGERRFCAIPCGAGDGGGAGARATTGWR